MLTGGLDDLYRDVLAKGARHYCRVEVWADGVQQAILKPRQGDEGGLVFLPGSAVSANMLSQVSRNLSLLVPDDLFPEDDGDLLAPLGNELRVWRGILLGDGSDRYVWQVFRGKIQEVTAEDRTGICTVQASDLAQDVIDCHFVRPENSIAGADRISEMQRLIKAVLPAAEFGTSDAFPELMPGLTWEFERGRALDEMFDTVGGLWLPLADGKFVARRYPWANPGAPLLTVSDGDGGVVLSSVRSRSRRNMFNSITAVAERLNGDGPEYATAQDTDPTSPTYVGGKFGIKSLVTRRQSAMTAGGVLTNAQVRLRSGITPTHTYGWSQVADASVELGDIVKVRRSLSGRERIQVITSFTLPLDQTEMTVQGRAQVTGAIEAGGF